MNCPQSPVFSIFTGDAKPMNLRVAYASGDPVDLGSCTEIVVNLPNADGTFTQLTLTAAKVTITSPAILGNFSAVIDATSSGKLAIGEGQSIDVTFTIPGNVDLNPGTVRYYGALSVFEAT